MFAGSVSQMKKNQTKTQPKSHFFGNILSDHVREKDQIIGIFMMLIIKNVLELVQAPIRNHIVPLNHFQMPFQIQNTITPSLKI